MNIASIIILAVIILAFLAAVRYHFRHGGKDACGGNCSSCQIDCGKDKR